MLEMLRGSIGGWTAKIFIGLLVLSFAVWGVSGTIFQGVGANVVQVGETKVGLLDYRLAYNQRLNALSRQLGTRLSREQANAFGLEQSVLSQLVSGAVLDENARKMGLGLSQDELAALIGDDPAFRDASGNFSRGQLQLALNQIGMREEDYIRNRTSVAVRNQIIQGTADGIKPPEAMLSAYNQYQNEKRVFDYVVIDDTVITEKPTPSDSDLRNYYEENKTTYVAPEYRKLVVVKLEPEDIADEASITDEAISEEYEANKTQYTTEEKRKIEQLVVTDAEKAKAYAERLKGGESYEKIVEEEGKTVADIQLGTFAKADLPDQNIADAAFILELNKPSDIVEGIFGSILLRVTEIEPEKITPLDEVKDEIKKSLALNKAADDLFDMHDKLEDERAAGDPLAAAAEKVGLTARTVEMVDARGLDEAGNPVEALPDQARLLREAFDVSAGVETDPLSLPGNGFVWYEVQEVIPDREKPLEEVKDQVTKDWTANKISEMVGEIATKIEERVTAGEVFGDVVAETLPDDSLGQKAKISVSPELDRRATHEDLNNRAVGAGFAVAKDTITSADMGGGKYALLVPKSIVEGAAADDTSQITDQLGDSISNDLLSQLVGDLQTQEDVVVDQHAIETALSL